PGPQPEADPAVLMQDQQNAALQMYDWEMEHSGPYGISSYGTFTRSRGFFVNPAFQYMGAMSQPVIKGAQKVAPVAGGLALGAINPAAGAAYFAALAAKDIYNDPTNPSAYMNFAIALSSDGLAEPWIAESEIGPTEKALASEAFGARAPATSRDGFARAPQWSSATGDLIIDGANLPGSAGVRVARRLT